MTSKALRNVIKLNDLIPLTDWFTPQQRADYRSRSLTADHTTAVQTAINEVEQSGGGYRLSMGDGVICLTAPIVVDQPIGIVGIGASPYVGALGTRGSGSWFYLNHAGVGFDIDGAGVLGGVRLDGFGTFRPQPNPSAGWAPGAFDFDFDIDNADVVMEDLLLLNPTKGVRLANGNAGRLTMEQVIGQPLQVGVQCDKSLDQLIASNCRFWPYWQNDSNVNAYTLANLDAWWFKRCDLPQLTNIFTFAARAGFRFSQTADGRVSKLQGVNLGFDFGKYGIWVDNSVTTSNVLGQIEGLVIQGADSAMGSIGIFVEGSNSILQLGSTDLRVFGREAIRVDGTGNSIRCGDLTIDGYNVDAAGASAIHLASGSGLQFGNRPIIGSGSWVSGAGTIEGLVTVQVANATTDGSGDVTISHGLGLTPKMVFPAPKNRTTFVSMQAHTIGGSSFKVRCLDAAGSPITATNFDIQWQAHA